MIYVPFAFRFEAFGSIKIDESDVTEYLFWSKRHHIPWKDIKDIGCGTHQAGFQHYSFVYFSVEPLTVEEMHKVGLKYGSDKFIKCSADILTRNKLERQIRKYRQGEIRSMPYQY